MSPEPKQPLVGDFARLTAVTVESLIRLETSLNRQRIVSTKPEYKAILAKMLDVCRSYKRYFFEHIKFFRKALAGETLQPDDETKVRLVLRNSAGAFLTLHELALFLPRESVRREMLSYCECLFREEFDLDRISILLTSVFNAFEYPLDEVMKMLSIDVFKMKIPNPDDLPFGNVMELAVVDRDNPLSWAILAHEFGHYIDHTALLSQQVATKFVDKTFESAATDEVRLFFERLCGEIVADITAYYLLGPCSIAPILTMSLLAGLPLEKPILSDGSHPIPTTRVKLLEKLGKGKMPMDHLQPLISALTTEELLKEAKLSQQQQESRNVIDTYVESFFDEVQGSILTELQKRGLRQFTEKHFAKANVLQDRLRRGLPIGAARTVSDDELRKELTNFDKIETETKIREKYGLLREMPVNPGEVLTAGWFYKIDQTPEIIRSTFSSDSEEELFNAMKSFVKDTDDRLLRSLEVISILEKIHGAAGC